MIALQAFYQSIEQTDSFLNVHLAYDPPLRFRRSLARNFLFDGGPQLGLLDLAHVGERHLSDDLQTFRPFVARHSACLQMSANRIEVERRARPELYISAGAFAKRRIRHRHDGGDHQIAHREQMSFDFLGIDFFAAAIDQILDASFDDQIASAAAAHQVAGLIESVGAESLEVAILSAVVAANRIWSAAP